jgi:hypothetical protein
MSVLGALAAALVRGRRVPRTGFTRLTTKQGPRGYYKGKGAAATGKHTSKGASEWRGVEWAGCGRGGGPATSGRSAVAFVALVKGPDMVP